MGKYFADIHADAPSQLANKPCGIKDSAEVAALRGAEGYDELMDLAKALSYQLRYRDAIEVYSRAVALEPDNILALRQRAGKHLATLQPEKAIKDFYRCRQLGGDEVDISYRLGICHYLRADYAAAMEELEHCFPLCGDEMAVAAVFWHTLSAWRTGKEPLLLQRGYREDMQVGHHAPYKFAMSLAAGNLGFEEAAAVLEKQGDDLEFSIMAYGVAAFMEQQGMDSKALREKLLSRDGFWISFCYIAAWNDGKRD